VEIFVLVVRMTSHAHSAEFYAKYLGPANLELLSRFFLAVSGVHRNDIPLGQGKYANRLHRLYVDYYVGWDNSWAAAYVGIVSSLSFAA
jgi:hypothetical protein